MRLWKLLVVALALVLAWLLWPRSNGAPAGSTGANASASRSASPQPSTVRPRPALDVRLAGRAAIAGVVSDPRGAPVAGAEVCARPGESQLRGPDALLRRCATSERDGHYRIEGLFGVAHAVHAAAPGFVPVMFTRGAGPRNHRVELRPGLELRDIDLTLEAGGVEVHGVVEDLSGGPIEGAEVTYGGMFAGTGMATATSGVEGAFSMWVRPGRVSLRAEAEGYAPGGDGGPAPGHRFEVFLTPEAALIGKVVRASDGSPVEGAEVRAESGDMFGGSRGTIYTDSAGNFRVGGLLPGAYKPRAQSDEVYGLAAEQVLLGLGETSAPITIEAHPAFFVEGKIVGDDGRACEEGTLTLTSPGLDRNLSAETEADGLVHLRGVLPGEYTARIRCTGFVAAEQYPPVRVVDGGVSGLRWQVARGRAIRGVVVDPRGATVQRISVNARPQLRADETRARSTAGHSGRSDPQGRFEVAGLLPGDYELSIYTYPESRARPEQPLRVTVPADRDLEGVRIELPAVGELRGRVRDTQGRGIARATIEVKGAQSRQGATADDGTYHIDGIGAGSYRVLVRRGSAPLRPPGRGDDDVQGEPVEVAANAVTNLDLVVADASGVIAGVVRDEDGAPVQDAHVEATRESESAAASGGALQSSRMRTGERPLLTDDDGRFRVEGLSPGKYTLRAQRVGGGEAVIEHVELGGDIVLTIAPTGRLSGIVALPGGGAPDEFTVKLRNRSTSFDRSDRFFRSDGVWTFNAVPPGVFEVDVSAAEGTRKLELSLGPGEVKSGVRVDLAGKITVRGTVVDVDGAPVRGAEVRISESGSFYIDVNEPTGKHISDEAGRFEVARAPTGRVTVLVGSHDGRGLPTTYLTIDIPGGQPVVEIPPLRVSRSRTAPGEAIGDLGYVFKQAPPGTTSDELQHIVALVRPGSPAAAAGLQVGDEIVAVDGHAVTGADAYLYRSLINVPAGTAVRLGLARGVTVTITAAKR